MQITTTTQNETIETRRVYITLTDGVEYELLETKEGLKINRNDGGSVLVLPASTNSITLVVIK